jgi:DNA-binding XRE family transcriptional regulator/predicted RNase H-like HicB family nuclease
MSFAYPLRFTPEPDEPGVFNVQGIEPMDNVITFGDDLEHAKAMAREALTGVLLSMLDNGVRVPRPPAAEGDDVHWIEPDSEVLAPLLLRWAREDAGLTQTDLADRLGMSYQAIQKLERPGANPTIKTLSRVSRALGRRLVVEIAPAS